MRPLSLLIALLCATSTFAAPPDVAVEREARLGPADGLRITNLRDGERLPQELAVIRGDAPGASTVTIVNGETMRAWPVHDGRFTATVRLAPGVNPISLTDDAEIGARLSFELERVASTTPYRVRLVYVLPADGDGHFQTPFDEVNDQAEGIARMRMNLALSQAAFSEMLYDHGFGRRSFRVERDMDGEPVVDVLRLQQSQGEIEAWYDVSGRNGQNRLGDAVRGAVQAELWPEIADAEHVLHVAVYAHARVANGTRYGYIANAAGRITVIHGANLYAQPTDLDGLIERLSDGRQVAAGYMNWGIGGSYSGVTSRAMGTFAHELGHLFGLPHPLAFDGVGRHFLTWPAFDDAPATVATRPNMRRGNAADLRFAPWARPDFEPHEADAAPVVEIDPISGVVTARSGAHGAPLRAVMFKPGALGGDVRVHDEWMVDGPTRYESSLGALVQRTMAAYPSWADQNADSAEIVLRVQARDDRGGRRSVSITVPLVDGVPVVPAAEATPPIVGDFLADAHAWDQWDGERTSRPTATGDDSESQVEVVRLDAQRALVSSMAVGPEGDLTWRLRVARDDGTAVTFGPAAELPIAPAGPRAPIPSARAVQLDDGRILGIIVGVRGAVAQLITTAGDVASFDGPKIPLGGDHTERASWDLVRLSGDRAFLSLADGGLLITVDGEAVSAEVTRLPRVHMAGPHATARGAGDQIAVAFRTRRGRVKVALFDAATQPPTLLSKKFLGLPGQGAPQITRMGGARYVVASTSAQGVTGLNIIRRKGDTLIKAGAADLGPTAAACMSRGSSRDLFVHRRPLSGLAGALGSVTGEVLHVSGNGPNQVFDAPTANPQPFFEAALGCSATQLSARTVLVVAETLAEGGGLVARVMRP